MRRRLCFLALTAIGLMALTPTAASAAARAFTPRFSTNDTGDVTGTANTLLTCPDSDSRCAGARAGTTTGSELNNNSYVMRYVDVDADPATFNSSTANLLLPAGATVLRAMLYWGADSTAGSGGASPPDAAARNTVLFQAPGQSYSLLTATSFDFITTDGNDFQGAVDVTAAVAGAGPGTYAVANVQAGTGRDRQAGWALTIAYRDTSQPPRNLTIFDGFQVVNSGNANISISVSGFQTPPTGPVRTRLGLIGYEGDAGSTGDTVKLNSTTVSDTVNPPNNVFNSSIAATGVHFPFKDPNYINQLGYDANFIRADGILPNGATSAVIRLTTGGETYFPGAVAFATDLYAPELELVKSVTDLDGGQVEPGDTLRYTVTATNTGGDTAANVVIEDPIPTHTTYAPGTLTVDGASMGDTFPGTDQAGFDAVNDRVVLWVGAGAATQKGGTLASGASSTVTFDVTVAAPPAAIPPGTLIANAASSSFIASTLGAPLTADSNQVTTTVAAPDLTVAKAPPDFTAVVGEPETFSLIVSNTGSAATDGSQVTVTDTPPPAVFGSITSVGGLGWTCTPPPTATITCTRTVPDVLAAGTSYPPIEITVDVDAVIPGAILNTAGVSGGGDGDTTNNSGTSVGQVTTRADLQLLKTADPATSRNGEPVTFTLRVRNGGPSTALGVTIDDTAIAADFDVVSATPSQGTCTTAITCALGDMAAGAEATVTIVAVATGAPGVHSNDASVTSSTTDPDLTNDDSDIGVAVAPTADLSVTKDASPDPLQSGAAATYTLTVHNDGPQPATNSVVTDVLPAPFTPTAPLPAGCSYTAADRTLSCLLATVASGADVTLAVTGTLSADSAGTILSNSALVDSATGDPDRTNNSDTDNSVVAPAADLELTKFADNAQPIAGGNVTFSLDLVNKGPTDAQNVRVEDTLPAGLTFVSASPGCAAAGQTVSCSLGSLAAGASVLLQIAARIGAGTAGTDLRNVAVAVSDTPDPIDANNEDATTISSGAPPGAPSADLAVSKRALNPARLGRSLRYEIVVQNAGPSAASGVTVSDTLPSQLDFVSATATQGSCTGTRTVTCALGDLASGASATVTLTVIPRKTGNVANSATAGSSTPDPNAANNVAATTVRTRLPRSRVRVSKRADRKAVTAGGVIGYRIALRNTGGAAARNVRVCDRLGSALAFVTRPGARLRNGQACWTVSRLARGKTRTFRVTARTLGVTTTRRVTNRVRVTASNVAARTARARVQVRPVPGAAGGVTG